MHVPAILREHHRDAACRGTAHALAVGNSAGDVGSRDPIGNDSALGDGGHPANDDEYDVSFAQGDQQQRGQDMLLHNQGVPQVPPPRAGMRCIERARAVVYSASAMEVCTSTVFVGIA